jgi:hypothetical protein
MLVEQKIRECIKSARHDFIRSEKASAWLHGYPESNTDHIENELERDALNVVIGTVAFTNAIEKKYGKPNPLTGGYDNCKDFNGLGTANFREGLEVLSFEVSISFFKEVAHHEGNGALVELIDSCVREKNTILNPIESVSVNNPLAAFSKGFFEELLLQPSKVHEQRLESLAASIGDGSFLAAELERNGRELAREQGLSSGNKLRSQAVAEVQPETLAVTAPIVDKPAKRLAQQAWPTQESLIIAKIKTIHLNCLKLPPYKPKGRNVKAEIRDALLTQNPQDFISEKVFNLAWDRLRRSGQIRSV